MTILAYNDTFLRRGDHPTVFGSVGVIRDKRREKAIHHNLPVVGSSILD